MSWITPPSPASGTGSSATAAAQYLVLGVNATLTGERVFTPAEGVSANDGGANSNYSLSVTSRVLDRSAASVVHSTTVTTTMYTLVILPNTLGTNKSIEVVAFGTTRMFRAVTTSASFHIALGATIMYEGVFNQPVATAQQPWFAKIRVSAEGATNAQILTGLMTSGLSLGATTGNGELATTETLFLTPLQGTAAVDSTTTLTLRMVMAYNGGTGPPSCSFTQKYAMARLI